MDNHDRREHDSELQEASKQIIADHHKLTSLILTKLDAKQDKIPTSILVTLMLALMSLAVSAGVQLERMDSFAKDRYPASVALPRNSNVDEALKKIDIKDAQQDIEDERLKSRIRQLEIRSGRQ